MLQLDPDATSVVRAKYCQAGPGFLAKNTATQDLDMMLDTKNTATQDLDNYKYCHLRPRNYIG